MKCEILKLQVGELTQLQFADNPSKGKFYVKVIGQLYPQSILITTPRIDGKVILVKEGQNIVIRLIGGKTISAFTTRVLRSCAVPYPYLHLTYPHEVESKVVRNSQRVSISLVAAVQNENPANTFERPVAALLTNISTGGAQIDSECPLGDIGDTLTISTHLMADEIEHHLILPAVIRNIDTRKNPEAASKWSHHCGTEFQLVDDSDRWLLHSFVYQNIIDNLTAK